MTSNPSPIATQPLTPSQGNQSDFSRSMERLDAGIRILTSFTLGSPLGHKAAPDKSSSSRYT